ncbi:unnamed protein product [Oikopleura dioica]|uniref:Uncharacterized protein n=1 Tax=Oikopleura dioica TaxID=34765 RepID=E4YJ14_OIKDI|nr:unnamed protein product [Oikopleura dioica]
MGRISEEQHEEYLESEAFVSCDEELQNEQPRGIVRLKQQNNLKSKRKKILTSFERENQQLKRRISQFAKASKEIENILSSRKKIEIYSMPRDSAKKEEKKESTGGAGAGDELSGHSTLLPELQKQLSKAARKERRYRNGIAIF